MTDLLFEPAVYLGRIERARSMMRETGHTALVLSVGSDLPYFTGYRAMPSERLTMAVIPVEAAAVLVVPELEAPRVEPIEGIRIQPWSEGTDPMAHVVEALPGGGRALLGDQTWGVFALQLAAAISGVTLVPAGPFTAQIRMHKTTQEIELLAGASAAADRVTAALGEIEFVGRTERDVSDAIARRLKQEGHETVGFAIVASGPNGASPHHEPGDRVILEGDQVVCDFGGTMMAYGSDTTRNVSVGEPSPRYREVFAVVDAAHGAAVDAVMPGAAAQDVDRAARSVIREAGYGEYFIHRTGHGIGMDGHEEPYIIEGNERLLEPGMAFSIEPGIYLPGKFGVRIEDIVVVTDGGVRNLNQSPHDLVIV